MRAMRGLFLISFAAAVLQYGFAMVALGQAVSKDMGRGKPSGGDVSFRVGVLPVLTKYCVSCHGADQAEGWSQPCGVSG